MKTKIENRKGMKIVVVVNEVENPKGLVFLMHGFIGFKEHHLLIETAKIFKENNFTAVSFDATHAFGESEGAMEEGTMTGYLEDLEDVVNWSKLQKWYREPFFMVGHSLGGYCVSVYAIKNKNVKGLILFSSIVSGKLFLETDDMKSIMEEWERKGIREWESESRPGAIKRSKYVFAEDCLGHDLLKVAGKIQCPVLMIAGEMDKVVPLNDQKMLFDKIRSKKEFHLVKNGDHNLIGWEKSEEFRNLVNNWVKSQ
jgi:alpha-beta hydrolase superfamily lysophospholipase